MVGVTGGIGTGKSTACGIIAERYPVLHSDDIARDLSERDPFVRSEIRTVFGDAVFEAMGGLNRRALADIVFGDPAKLAALDAIVHPRAVERIRKEARDLFDQGHAMIFVESALIFEAGIEEMFNSIIVIAAKEETVKARLRAAGRLTEAEWRQRAARQLTDEEKIADADFTVHNDGSEAELRSRIGFILTILGSLSS
jgi:dephospho-CoA kinase